MQAMLNFWSGKPPVRDSAEHKFWWNWHLTWMQIANRRAALFHNWERFTWQWQSIASAYSSYCEAQQARKKLEFVRSDYNRCWGVVVERTKRKGQGDLCKVRVLRDRHYNWVTEPYIKTLDEHWLTPVPAWDADVQSPWSMIPTRVTHTRWQIGWNKKAERARKQVLRRQWRGLE